MQDVILLVSTSAIFIFGYFLMNKLDVFLENNWNRQETALTYGENSLRIGFSNPLMAGGLADAFETYGKQHPDVSIHIFSGEESELCRELETHKLVEQTCFKSKCNRKSGHNQGSGLSDFTSDSLRL